MPPLNILGDFGGGGETGRSIERRGTETEAQFARRLQTACTNSAMPPDAGCTSAHTSPGNVRSRGPCFTGHINPFSVRTR